MANLDQLFAFEHAIESAWQTILATIDDDLTPYIEATDLDKQAPYIEIQLQNATPEANQRFVTTDGIAYFSAWSARLITRIVTVRGKNSDRQAEFIGKVRVRASGSLLPSQDSPQSVVPLFTQEILPFHNIMYLAEAGMHRGIVPDQRLDWAELHHQIKFSIRTDAWPLSGGTGIAGAGLSHRWSLNIKNTLGATVVADDPLIVIGDSEVNWSVKVYPGTTEEIDAAVPVARITSGFVSSDQAVDVFTNAPDGSGGQVIALQSQRALDWNDTLPWASPFTPNITKWFVTNSGTNIATVRGGFLLQE